MKTCLIFLNILVCVVVANAQATDVVTNVQEPTSVFIYNGNIYFGLWRGGLLKANLDTPTAISTVVPSSGIYRSAFYEEELYFTQPGESKISKIDLTQESPTPVDVVTGLDIPTGIVINQGILYYSVGYQMSKINLADANPVSTVVCNRGISSAYSIAIVGDEMYIAEFRENQISKFNLSVPNPTPEVVLTGLNEPTSLLVRDSELFVSEFSGNRIIRIDVSVADPVAETVLSPIKQPTGLALKGNTLYVSEFGDNKIVKFELPTSSANQEVFAKNHMRVFPNPCSNTLNLQGLEVTQNYVISNLVGVECGKGRAFNGQPVSVTDLVPGTYFISLDSGKTLRFLKK